MVITPRSTRSRRGLALSAAVLGGLAFVAAISAGPASAAPKADGYVTITCDNGHTYTAVSPNGNGDFTPAIATDGTVLTPKAFGPSTYSFSIDGVVTDSGTNPARSLGAAERNPQATTQCSYTGSGSFSDGVHLYEFSFSGTATVVVAGHVK